MHQGSHYSFDTPSYETPGAPVIPSDNYGRMQPKRVRFHFRADYFTPASAGIDIDGANVKKNGELGQYRASKYISWKPGEPVDDWLLPYLQRAVDAYNASLQDPPASIEFPDQPEHQEESA